MYRPAGLNIHEHIFFWPLSVCINYRNHFGPLWNQSYRNVRTGGISDPLYVAKRLALSALIPPVISIGWKYDRLVASLVQMIFLVASVHYAALPIKMCQLENWAIFSPQPPFSWALIISDKIFGFQTLSSFTFKIYLGPSSSFSPIFMCFNYFRQSSNTLCECLEDQLNVALKSRLQIFLMI